MAKVTNPLFTDFREAFADVIVFQRNGSSSTIARQKVVHPTNPNSAHYPARIDGWAKALTEFNKDQAPDEQLIDYVSRFALSPNSPFNLRTTSLVQDPQNPEQQIAGLAWDAPTTKYNGWPLDNLAGYFVEISTNLVTWTRCNAEPFITANATVSIPPGDVYFIVIAVDDQGNASTPSQSELIQYSGGGPPIIPF